ncbi:DUF6194 family protein [Geodermatophilus nigrescens]|uniref:DUF6194 domain-containing protein n=1 Tax=Geodermatophilus nigrescens TaxID=1070870 RepID=A0A1M5D7H2_9ACTN|nr:DUF6194 family protein [Geodermatophilus nigrescens]SHF62966.1 hypothetical protein SAMN05444351_0255 [Geodermatophilus nigrescens]
MSIDEILAAVTPLDGVLVLRPGPGDGSPEEAEGDVFLYVAPDGVVPRTQPFATVVTKDVPGDRSSRLDRSPDTFRVNVAAGTAGFTALVGRGPREEPAAGEPAPDAVDTVLAHPVYGSLGWVSVVDPGPRTEATVRDLLRDAHARALARAARRAGSAPL